VEAKEDLKPGVVETAGPSLEQCSFVPAGCGRPFTLKTVFMIALPRSYPCTNIDAPFITP
jgi:hypothetical protein